MKRYVKKRLHPNIWRVWRDTWRFSWLSGTRDNADPLRKPQTWPVRIRNSRSQKRENHLRISKNKEIEVLKITKRSSYLLILRSIRLLFAPVLPVSFLDVPDHFQSFGVGQIAGGRVETEYIRLGVEAGSAKFSFKSELMKEKYLIKSFFYELIKKI